MPNLAISKLFTVLNLQATDQLAIVSQRNGVPTTQKIPLNLIAEIVPVTVKISLTSPQILALLSTPIEVVPAPGAGKAIHVIAAFGSLTFGTNAYTTFTDAVLTAPSRVGSSFQNILSGFFGAGANDTLLGIRSASGGNQSPTNESLVIAGSGGNPVAGDGTADVSVTYVIINI